jgi:hypothetical protein
MKIFCAVDALAFRRRDYIIELEFKKKEERYGKGNDL